MALQLEPEFAEIYNTWKTNPSPETNNKFIEAIKPILDTGITIHIGTKNPNLLSQAKIIALDALPRYDPTKTKLKTFLINSLNSLKRFSRQQNSIVYVPEQLQIEKHQLDAIREAMASELGREPTDQELMEQTGLSSKRLKRIRQFNVPLATSQLVDPETGNEFTGESKAIGDTKKQDIWVNIVYQDLPPTHKKVMELTLGLNGHKKHSNLEIAKKLGKTPGAISQIKNKIQKLLDEEQDLSPFLGNS
jgi:DNA-directed RNA polymerase specialized sigma subunit